MGYILDIGSVMIRVCMMSITVLLTSTMAFTDGWTNCMELTSYQEPKSLRHDWSELAKKQMLEASYNHGTFCIQRGPLSPSGTNCQCVVTSHMSCFVLDFFSVTGSMAAYRLNTDHEHHRAFNVNHGVHGMMDILYRTYQLPGTKSLRHDSSGLAKLCITK